ncbi:hypothetical protein [Actinomadura chibensis]|uniref:Uncharacterized protein n=1 Tax=Actinomadura chibensis TaxID=392828 RepID=A0A5D0NQN0_9ACTN|nr:hypothetical protein [Actinomadura chibensis]TYB46619.1 hypothetical protein FXF69_15495 [Actinomadura chibensis]
MAVPPADRSTTEDETGDETGGAARRPLALRPSRRPLVWAVPLLVPAAYIEVRVFGEFRLFFLNNALIVGLVFLVAMVLKLLRGRTDADAVGVRNRLVGRTKRMAWSEISELTVTPTLFGRVVTVRGQAVRRTMLAAPREGLLGRDPDFDETLRAMRALAGARGPRVTDNVHRSARITYWAMIAVFLGAGVFLWRPWLETWWPGVDEATELPRACAVADPATAARLLPAPGRPAARERDMRYSESSDCRYRDADDRVLALQLDLDQRTNSSGGAAQIRDDYATALRIEADAARSRAAHPDEWTVTTGGVPGLGDEAWRSVSVGRSDGEAEVRLVARRANVVVQVRYDAKRPADQAASEAAALARRALDRIEFR